MSPRLERIPFGRTGHESSRIVFGAAALAFMRQERADPLLDVLLEYGVNHIDTAASYGDAELRIAPWLRALDFYQAKETVGFYDLTNVPAYLDRFLERPAVKRGLNIPKRPE